MNLAQAILLGALQGATEFLPVSSSAHLVIAQHLLHVGAHGAGLVVALHVGTLVAILLVFGRRLGLLVMDGAVGVGLWATHRTGEIEVEAPLFPTALALLVGSVPAGIVGIAWGSVLEAVFDSPAAAGGLLIVTGLMLAASRFAPKPSVPTVGPLRGLVMGLAQAVAILPGISRSGATIVAGYFCGVERAEAARFSFLLAVPALAGAALLKLPAAVSGLSSADVRALLVGVAVSATVGMACLLGLMRLVERGRLHWFAVYCIPAGLAVLLWGLKG